MKNYTSDTPVFSETIKVVETTDPAHADNINAATKQLLQNTLVNQQALSGLFGFMYEGNGLLYNAIGCAYDRGMLSILSGLTSVRDKVLTLTDGIIPSGGGGGGGGGSYVLPVATANTLGGVMIGKGIDVARDGTISANVDASAEKAATLVEQGMHDISSEEVSNLFDTV